MVFLKSLTCVAAGLLFLQQAASMPTKSPKALLDKRATLNGKFLHITDIHIDQYYVIGGDTDDYCHKVTSGDDNTGTFGNLGSKCDSPTALVQATFNFLKNSVQDIDFIVYTGDTVRHDRDDNMPRTQNDITTGHTTVMNYFQAAYNTQNVPYIPTIGNNDALNADSLVASDPIYSQLETIWAPLGLNLTTTFTTGGYYVQDVIPGKLTIINLNSMFFFEDNDSVKDCSTSSSPSAIEMTWLSNTLKYYASQSGHNVYIMSHVPPVDDDGSSKLYTSDCYTKYLTLLGQYGNIIRGHFNGHTNNDDLGTIVSSKGTSFSYTNPDTASSGTSINGTMALFNAPSVIPVNNPALRVYSYDATGVNHPVGTITDWKQYYVDLNSANSDGTATFQLEYTASTFYNVSAFDGPGTSTAIENIASSKTAKKQYDAYSTVLS